MAWTSKKLLQSVDNGWGDSEEEDDEDWDGEEIVPFWPPVMDSCEEALDPSCTDLARINQVLEEVDDEEFEHPVVDALVNKQEALEAYLSGGSVMQEVLTGRADGT